MAKKRLRPEDKKALDFWEKYYKNINAKDEVDFNETPEQQKKRIQALEADPEAWFSYYFAKYCTHEPMPFHKNSSKRVLGNAEWYEVRPWARSLSKSGRAMMEFIYLALTKRKKFIVIASATEESAIRLLKPFKQTFENNRRIINDYGVQENFGHWKDKDFTIKAGAMFVAVGAGNAPRGARNEEVRPDAILVDDFDTDEDCRNPDMVDKKWEWFERALYASRDPAYPVLVLFNGNIIADYCCIKKAMEKADYYEIVNIRDKNGKSTWPNKNSEEAIDRTLSKISQASVQGEYFNNPVRLGKVFQQLHYGKVQPLHKYKFLIAYTDPSYKKNGDYKATVLVGKYKDEYHVLWVGCDKTSIAQMLDWQYEILDLVGSKTSVYFYIEWPWIDDSLKAEINQANKRHGVTLSLKADDRKKPEKFYRIEALLEPLNRAGKLIFNEHLKGKPYMDNMEFQFLALSAKSRANDDGPDAVEGAVWKINHKIRTEINSAPPKVWEKPVNKKRF
ncbi:hypothetical protein ACILDT_11545 [Capnocytophaga canis]|uniref:hypothetical protein n=1 Tax=Capnocytophaga canis TaxID=1848903 RepID=UPI0037D7F17F